MILLLYISIVESKAQYSTIYSRHNNYDPFINPAITGRDDYPFLNISHRKNWIGVKHSPTSTAIGAAMRLGRFNFYTPDKMLNKSSFLSKERMGLGGIVMHELNGPVEQIMAMGNYAYFIPLSPNGVSELSFGLSFQLSRMGINESLLEPLDAGDPKLMNLDEYYWLPESSFGAYYHDNQFQIGFSVNELLQSEIPYAGEVNNKRDIFLLSGYKFFLKYFELEPYIFTGFIDDRPVYVYSRLKLYYRDYNWIAISYKSVNAVSASVGFRLSRMFFAYEYEHNISRLENYFAGAHEIMIGLNIGLFESKGIRKLSNE